MQHVKQVMSCQKFFWWNSVPLSIGYGKGQAMHSYTNKMFFEKYSFLEYIDIQNQNLFCFHSPEMYPLITFPSN